MAIAVFVVDARDLRARPLEVAGRIAAWRGVTPPAGATAVPAHAYGREALSEWVASLIVERESACALHAELLAACVMLPSTAPEALDVAAEAAQAARAGVAALREWRLRIADWPALEREREAFRDRSQLLEPELAGLEARVHRAAAAAPFDAGRLRNHERLRENERRLSDAGEVGALKAELAQARAEAAAARGKVQAAEAKAHVAAEAKAHVAAGAAASPAAS